ncbi:MAG TPA: nuclear transport factor 2 family protein [Candidatus Acidoferrales bacterium]|nr:nuclear transport factor 2 family protein [Candidatus Acidoferrales bacterium]
MDVSSVTDSLESARTFVKEVETAFGTGDVDQMIKGFTDDVVVRFADRPEMHGIAEVEKFLRVRMARQKNYRLKKYLRMLSADMIGNMWEGEWEDAQTGKSMLGRGTEFWTMRGRKIAVWEATFNVWEAGATQYLF